MVGSLTHFVGRFTIEGLFGRDLSPVGGGFEGLVLGAAVGAGYALATPLEGGGMATPRDRARWKVAAAAGVSPNRKIFEARKRETAALGAGEKLVLGHPLAATIGDSARCMQNLEKVLFTGPKTSDTVTFICD